MAKSTGKTTAAKPAKKTAAVPDIEKVSVTILDKLRALNIEPQLQGGIEWCLGSYRADHNPVGLYDMARRALAVFQAEQQKKTKGVTAKLINDIEKALS